MQPFRRILVGVDLDADGAVTEPTRAAIAQAGWLARSHEAAVTLVHVVQVPTELRAVLARRPTLASSQARERIETVLDELAAEHAGIEVSRAVRFGVHWKELLAEVGEGGHELVVLGTKARGPVGRAVFGSTGNRLLRRCAVPVWVVKPGHEALRRIVVAHDLTETGARALTLAAEFARLAGSELQVLHAIEHEEDSRFLGTLDRSALEEREREKRALLEAECRAQGCLEAARLRVVSGNPHTEILRALEELQADLLCMGTVARSGLAGILTGNTAENVLPWADCSLLAVKPEGFRTPATS